MSVDPALLTLVAETLEVDAGGLTRDTRFDELGRTSFQEVELFTGIEDRFRVRLDFTKYTELATIGELDDLVRGARG
jgi:acyl carrier protein